VHADALACQPPRPAARAALLRALDTGWADPGRMYRSGRQARALLEAARGQVAAQVGLPAAGVSFLPSVPAALSLAVEGALGGRRGGPGWPRTVIASAVEQAILLEALTDWQAAEPTRMLHLVPVDSDGVIDAGALRAVLATAPGPALVVVQQANHEVGSLQPQAAVAAACRAAGATLLVDATMGRGLLPPPPADVVVLGAPGWGGGPLGILAVTPGTRWRAPLTGDGHEAGRFPGPVFVPLAVAAAVALDEAVRDRPAEAAHLDELSRLARAQLRTIPGSLLLGHPEAAVPGTVAVSFLYVEAAALLGLLDARGQAVSSGSSCVIDAVGPSHVLRAMGALSQGNLRLTFPAAAAEEEVSALVAAIAGAVAAVRAELGAPDA